MSVRLRLLVTLWAALGLSSCAPTPTSPVSPTSRAREESHSSVSLVSPETPQTQDGYATWYGPRFAGRKMANGHRFDPSAMTAAHRTLPLGTWVEVKRRDTGKTVRVRITDRGPFGEPSRIVDLSKAAAERLDMIRLGVVLVELRVVSGP